MSEINSAPIDKSKWPRGPWTDEPDRVEFEHAGFPCLITRQESSGHLCGYVAVPPGHRWHGVDYDEVRTVDGDWPEAHGGLTYASKCSGSIRHVPKPGESDAVWWLGFDAAHAGDVSPGHDVRRIGAETGWGSVHAYRTVAYMRAECERLAEQAATVGRSA